MADFKIPKLDMKSNKYIFKKKLVLRNKSRKRLLSESFLMFFLALFLIYLNFLIPNKNLLLSGLTITLKKIYLLTIDLSSNFVQILLVIFIFLSIPITLILFIGSLYRIYRVLKRRIK